MQVDLTATENRFTRGQVYLDFGDFGPPKVFEISRDGQLGAIGFRFGKVALVDMGKLEIVSVFDAHDNAVLGLSFSYDGSILASSAIGGPPALFDTTRLEPIALEILHENSNGSNRAADVEFGGPDNSIAVAFVDRVAIINVDEHVVLNELRRIQGRILDIEYSAAQDAFVYGTEFGIIGVIDNLNLAEVVARVKLMGAGSQN